MQRKLALVILAAVTALVAFGRRRARRRAAAAEPSPAADPRAESLRQRLAERREAETPPIEPTQPLDAPAATGAEPPPADEFEAMRRRVHAEARAAAAEMRRRSGGEGDAAE